MFFLIGFFASCAVVGLGIVFAIRIPMTRPPRPQFGARAGKTHIMFCEAIEKAAEGKRVCVWGPRGMFELVKVPNVSAEPIVDVTREDIFEIMPTKEGD